MVKNLEQAEKSTENELKNIEKVAKNFVDCLSIIDVKRWQNILKSLPLSVSQSPNNLENFERLLKRLKIEAEFGDMFKDESLLDGAIGRFDLNIYYHMSDLNKLAFFMKVQEPKGTHKSQRTALLLKAIITEDEKTKNSIFKNWEKIGF